MMHLNNYQFLKKKENLVLFLLVFLSVLIRIPIILIYGDTNLENEWAALVNNLILHGTLSYKSFEDFLLPNLFMPPLYAYYLYVFSFLNLAEQNYINLVLLSQALLASISIVVFYKINKIFFSEKVSFYSSLLFSFFPLHVYACSQISSVSLQSFFLILFFYFFFKLIEKKNFLSIFIFSFISGLLILLRGEFFVILIFSFLYLFFFLKVKLKNILFIILITLITVSPYLIRNIVIFEKITITKSLGYNLWKGNNPNSTVEGSEFTNDNLKKEIYDIPKDKFFRINFDKIFMNEAKKNITNEPQKYLILFLKKIASFLFIDINSSQSNYYNPLHYLPVVLLGITSLIGIIISDKKSYKMNYLIFVFFFNIIIFSSFFILARYKLAILPLQIIFTNVLINHLKNNFFKT